MVSVVILLRARSPAPYLETRKILGSNQTDRLTRNSHRLFRGSRGRKRFGPVGRYRSRCHGFPLSATRATRATLATVVWSRPLAAGPRPPLLIVTSMASWAVGQIIWWRGYIGLLPTPTKAPQLPKIGSRTGPCARWMIARGGRRWRRLYRWGEQVSTSRVDGLLSGRRRRRARRARRAAAIACGGQPAHNDKRGGPRNKWQTNATA